jgi:hypothetical protein
MTTTNNILRAFVRGSFKARSSSYRAYASVSSSSPFNPTTVGPFQVFDRNAKRLQKNRSAVKEDGQASRTVDYVREEVADRMMERLLVGCLLITIMPISYGPGHSFRISKENLAAFWTLALVLVIYLRCLKPQRPQK